MNLVEAPHRGQVADIAQPAGVALHGLVVVQLLVDEHRRSVEQLGKSACMRAALMLSERWPSPSVSASITNRSERFDSMTNRVAVEEVDEHRLIHMAVYGARSLLAS